MNPTLKDELSRHRSATFGDDDPAHCANCMQPWPCDASRALAELEAAESRWIEEQKEALENTAARAAFFARNAVYDEAADLLSIQPEEDGGWSVSIKAMPGHIGGGDTFEEACNAAHDAAEAWVEAHRARADTAERDRDWWEAEAKRRTELVVAAERDRAALQEAIYGMDREIGSWLSDYAPGQSWLRALRAAYGDMPGSPSDSDIAADAAEPHPRVHPEHGCPAEYRQQIIEEERARLLDALDAKLSEGFATNSGLARVVISEVANWSMGQRTISPSEGIDQ